MKKKNIRGKGCGKQRKDYCQEGYLHGKYINVTDHAIMRYQQRIKRASRENAGNFIVESVKRSRLIALTKYGGREIRENRGILYVCELEGSCLNVITILIGDVDLRFAM